MKCRKRRVCGVLIISIIYICFSLYSVIEYREFINARIDMKVAIAKELEIDYTNPKKLDKQLRMTARHYTRESYEDIKVTFRKDYLSSSEVVYDQLASVLELYDKESQEYIEYLHILNAADSFIVYQEECNMIIVEIGEINVAILNLFKIVVSIIFLLLGILYVMSCYWTKSLVAPRDYRKAMSHALGKKIFK